MADFHAGAAYGSVSASFVVQQPGLPRLALGKGETWNGECPHQRLRRYFRGSYVLRFSESR